MGRKNKPSKESAQVTEESDDERQEFELNLKALDGYDLPDTEEEADRDEEQPKKKKKKKEISKPRVLGIDYREREEHRLEQLLFGELLQNFEKKSQSVETAVPTKSKGKGKKEQAPTETSSDVLPVDKFGNRLGLSTLNDRKAAWVDDDDVTLE